MGIKKIERIRVGDQAYEQMRRQLLRGVWKPGDRLPSEHELAAGMGVSRVTVRQAIQKLATLGLLESRVGEGTFVRDFTPGKIMAGMIPAAYLGGSSVMEALEFRRMIEVPAAELAARKATAEELAALQGIYIRMLESTRDRHAFFQADLDFHMAMVTATHNTLAIEAYSILRAVLEVAMERIVEVRGHSQGIHFHGRLLEAMQARDEALCRLVMEEHIDDTYRAMQEMAADK